MRFVKHLMIPLACCYCILSADTGYSELSAADQFIADATGAAKASLPTYTYDQPRFPDDSKASESWMEARNANGGTTMIPYALDPAILRKVPQWKRDVLLQLPRKTAPATSRYFGNLSYDNTLHIGNDGNFPFPDATPGSDDFFYQVDYDAKGRVLDIYEHPNKDTRNTYTQINPNVDTFLLKQSFVYLDDAIFAIEYAILDKRPHYILAYCYEGAPPELMKDKSPKQVLRIHACDEKYLIRSTPIQTVYEYNAAGAFERSIDYQPAATSRGSARPCQAERYLFELGQLTTDENITDEVRCDAYGKMAQFRPEPNEECWNDYDLLNDRALQALVCCPSEYCLDQLVKLSEDSSTKQKAQSALFWRGDYRFEPPYPNANVNANLPQMLQQALHWWSQSNNHFFVRCMREIMPKLPRIKVPMKKGRHEHMELPLQTGKQIVAIQLEPAQASYTLFMAAALPIDAKLIKWKIVADRGSLNQFKRYYERTGINVPGPWPASDQVILACSPTMALQPGVTYCIWLLIDAATPGVLQLAVAGEHLDIPLKRADRFNYDDSGIATMIGLDNDILLKEIHERQNR